MVGQKQGVVNHVCVAPGSAFRGAFSAELKILFLLFLCRCFSGYWQPSAKAGPRLRVARLWEVNPPPMSAAPR
jgi:hypothetical protein